ncbi:prominin-2 [Brachionichthys hirsutus]|uniref:prominin-2 n=1 Tax=Brachionichthys hirsutus TaxID=412623 RepID=UPI0036046809
MGLCANMTRRRRWGCTGAFRAGVGLLLLGLTMAQSVPSPSTSCPASEVPQSLTQPQYHSTPMDDGGFMAGLVQSFLHSVQPNPFPEDLILKVVQDINNQQFNQRTIRNILVYQVGFLVCVVIGILYIVLMPIVGLCLACCRCCGNCGGKMHQKQTSSIACRRRTLYWSAFITTGIIFAGNICMFKSNDVLRTSVDQSPEELNNTVNNLHTFLTAVHEQVNNVVDEGYNTVDGVTSNLDAIGPQLGAEIQDRFMEVLLPLLRSVQLLDQETVKTETQLNQLNSSVLRLQSSLDLLQANFTAVKNRVNQTFSKPACASCSSRIPELNELTLDTSISISILNELQSAVDEVIKINLTSQIKEVEDQFDNIPETVTSEAMDVVQSSKELLREIKRQIYNLIDGVPLSALTDMSQTLDDVQREIYNVAPEVEKVDDIRWGLCLLLCLLVLLVVVCNLLGLLLGPLGLKSKVDPKKRSCTSNCGTIFLMMGTGFSFIFSWLFMIVVLLLFLLGGNVYTLVCHPWSNGDLLKFIETSDLFPELQIGPALGLDVNVSLADLYSDCQENQPLWTALHMDEVINLDERLNVTQYTEQIQDLFNSTDITLTTITLMSPDLREKLIKLSTLAKNVDYTAITQQMNNISSINLNTTADMLDLLAATQVDPDIKNELQDEASTLRQIQSNIEATITPQLENINSTLKDLQSTAEKVNGTAGEVLSNEKAAQDFLTTNTTLIVENESEAFVDCQLGYVESYVDWAKLSLTQQLGRCGPLAGAVDSAEVIACSYVVGSLNAFWFSLGWCMMFFIPSIIFSTKLAKYYRKMKYSDVQDDLVIMNHFPRAQMKPH